MSDSGKAEIIPRNWFTPASVTSSEEPAGTRVRFAQFNTLAECYATQSSFPAVDPAFLHWDYRFPLLIAEILAVNADFIGLEEVDRFDDYQAALNPHGYAGIYERKESHSPTKDGCALFYRTDKVVLLWNKRIVLRSEELGIPKMPQASILSMFQVLGENQVPIAGSEFIVAVGHLKAKKEFATTRVAQCKVLLGALEEELAKAPGAAYVILGDMNTDPDSGVYNQFIEFRDGLKSAYSLYRQEGEPEYTTSKDRGTIVQRTIDYIFYTPGKWILRQLYSIPTLEEIGPKLLPAPRYGSDHILIAAEFVIAPK